MTLRSGSATRTPIHTFVGHQRQRRADDVTTEEPLEIRLRAGGQQQTVAVTLRTPGADFELAAGFLYTEGLIHGKEAIRQISYCLDATTDAEQQYNSVRVSLHADALPDLAAVSARHFVTSTACGVCGKASIEALPARGCVALPAGAPVSIDLIYSLPDRLRAAQRLFASTGGVHAAALFDRHGAMLAVREDIGRHNALDKLIGWALLNDLLPLHDHVVMSSGRLSFDMAQKAIRAGAPILCGVSAPSSLAVSAAHAFGLTLIGFLRDRRCNVYAGVERLAVPEPTPPETP